MSETRDFLKRLKQEGLVRADITCGKEHVVISEKAARESHSSKAFQQVRTQLMSRKKLEKQTLLYILGAVFVVAILVSFLDDNVSGFYRSLLVSSGEPIEKQVQDSANLSSTALSALDSNGKSRELIKAIQKGNTAIARKLLELETDINGMDEKGNTPLITAINYGRKDITEILLDNGASINVPEKSGLTPAMAAAGKGNRLILGRLLKNGAKIGQVDNKGNSALSYAVKSSCTPCVSMLLKRGAKVDQPDGKGRTPLFVAASVGNKSICVALIKAGASVNKATADGRTALMEAAGLGNIEVARKLLSAGAVLIAKSNSGDTPLTEAVKNGHPNMVHLLLTEAAEKKIMLPEAVSLLSVALQEKKIQVAQEMIQAGIRRPLPKPPVTGGILKEWIAYRELLRKISGEKEYLKVDERLRNAAGSGKIKEILSALKAGADPAITDKNKDNAVMLAVRNHQLAALKTLLAYGAPVESIDTDNGESPLLIAAKIKDRRFATLLLEAGAKPDKPGLNGYTALDYAFASGNRWVIPTLSKFGAKAATEWNKNQWTPLEFVIASGKLNMLDILIRNTADIDKTDANGWSALHYAIMLGKPDIASKLLKKGADINLRDKKDWNPLHFAVLAGRLDILKTLLSNGTKVNRRNNANWPPLYLAIALRHPDMVRSLLKAGAKTRYKTDIKVLLPPLTIPAGSRADKISAILLKNNPGDLIAKEIQKEIRGK